MSSSSPMADYSSYWCYSCRSFVRIRLSLPAIACPDCGGGFLEEAPSPPPPPPRRTRRSSASGERSHFNPVIVLRGPSDNSNPPAAFELFYDDGAGSGLRPLPATVSDFLMGSGFDRLLDQLSQLELTGAAARAAADQPPASKSAIESMPTITISDSHITSEPHCAVCKEAFDLHAEAREMPCKHIYHHDCILPWLSIRNSCPVCRHELPADEREIHEEDSAVGLTIWRLPGGGFAVGRFSGGRRPGNRELPVVYTEMDGGFNVGGAPRRVSWSSGGNQARESGGIVRAVRSFFSFFRRSRSSSSSSVSRNSLRSRRQQGEGSRRSRGNWMVEEPSEGGISRW